MANMEYADFDKSLLNEIENGKPLGDIAADENSGLQNIARVHRVNNPWRNHVNFSDLVNKRLKILCKEGRIYHDGQKWQVFLTQANAC
jgi:hypothetical protein